MGKTRSKQDHNADISLNAYEKEKLMRVKENQQKMRDIGVTNIVNSLTSLVQSHKTKKGKEKTKVVTEKDLDYIPDFDEGGEGDDEEESATTPIVRKKVTQSRQHFIPPMSVNKYVSLTNRRRVIAPNLSNTSSIGLQLENHQGRTAQSFDKYGIGKNQARSTMTLGDMVLHKKQSQQQNKKLQDESSGLRRRLFSEDNPNDSLDDVGCDMELEGDELNVIQADKRRDDDKDDEDEDIDQLLLEKNVIESEEGEYESEDENVDFYDHNMSTADEEVEFEQQCQDTRPRKGAKSSGGTRGPTMMHNVHTRTLDQREVIICNEFGQPIGPSTPEKDTVGEFSRFLGTIAHGHNYAPLTYKSWDKVPHKKKMWEYVLEKYIVPDEAKYWVLKSIGAAWSVYKCRIKKNHFYKFNDNKTRWKNRPIQVPKDDFVQLLAKWNKKEEKKRSLLARDRRKSQKNMHTAGPKSFARIREELKNADPNKASPSLVQMFEHTRKRKDGHVYLDTYDDTAKKNK